MARGNVPAAIKMTVLGLLLGSLLTPVYIHVLMGASIDIPMARIFREILLLVFLPLLLGYATQRLLIRRYGLHSPSSIRRMVSQVATARAARRGSESCVAGGREMVDNA